MTLEVENIDLNHIKNADTFIHWFRDSISSKYEGMEDYLLVGADKVERSDWYMDTEYKVINNSFDYLHDNLTDKQKTIRREKLRSVFRKSLFGVNVFVGFAGMEEHRALIEGELEIVTKKAHELRAIILRRDNYSDHDNGDEYDFVYDLHLFFPNPYILFN